MILIFKEGRQDSHWEPDVSYRALQGHTSRQRAIEPTFGRGPEFSQVAGRESRRNKTKSQLSELGHKMETLSQ